jgi:hypothetical protein
MIKKALCVGVNDYPTNSKTKQNIDLKGCVNDANLWASLLNSQFDFSKPDVEIVLDQEATKSNIVSGLKTLLSGAQADDVLVYSFSGHGTYLAAKSQNQLDYDQAQCPYDWEENLLVDNELRELFFNLPRGVRLTVISDSCHSGSVTRKGKEEMGSSRSFSQMTKDEEDAYLSPLTGVQKQRHLPPGLFGGDELNEMEFDDLENSFGQPYSLFTPEHPESEMNDVLISGCNQLEFSMDAPFPGGHHGALTFYATHAIKRANYEITYKDMHKQVRKWLRKYKFKQTPQLEGKAENKDRLLFT